MKLIWEIRWEAEDIWYLYNPLSGKRVFIGSKEECYDMFYKNFDRPHSTVIYIQERIMPWPRKNRPRKGRRKIGSAKRKKRANKK